jgi:hypothetical protein
VVSLSELAEAMRTSRWTVRRWMEKGYKFQYGNRTTPGRCRKWLEEHAHDLKRKSLSSEDIDRQRILLARLRETRRKQKAAEGSIVLLDQGWARNSRGPILPTTTLWHAHTPIGLDDQSARSSVLRLPERTFRRE